MKARGARKKKRRGKRPTVSAKKEKGETWPHKCPKGEGKISSAYECGGKKKREIVPFHPTQGKKARPSIKKEEEEKKFGKS